MEGGILQLSSNELGLQFVNNTGPKHATIINSRQ